jgi:hypothetical protein
LGDTSFGADRFAAGSVALGDEFLSSDIFSLGERFLASDTAFPSLYLSLEPSTLRLSVLSCISILYALALQPMKMR